MKKELLIFCMLFVYISLYGKNYSLASTNKDGSIKFLKWDSVKNKNIEKMDGIYKKKKNKILKGSKIEDVSLCGRYLALFSKNKEKFYIFDIKQKKIIHTGEIDSKGTKYSGIFFMPSNNDLAVFFNDNMVGIFNYKICKMYKDIVFLKKEKTDCLFFNPKKNNEFYKLKMYKKGLMDLALYKFENSKEDPMPIAEFIKKTELPADGMNNSGVFSPKEDVCALFGSKGVSIFNLEKEEITKKIKILKIKFVSFSPKGDLLFVGNAKGKIKVKCKIKVFDVKDWKEKYSFKIGKKWIVGNNKSISNNGKYLVARGSNEILLCDLEEIERIELEKLKNKKKKSKKSGFLKLFKKRKLRNPIQVFEYKGVNSIMFVPGSKSNNKKKALKQKVLPKKEKLVEILEL